MELHRIMMEIEMGFRMELSITHVCTMKVWVVFPQVFRQRHLSIDLVI